MECFQLLRKFLTDCCCNCLHCIETQVPQQFFLKELLIHRIQICQPPVVYNKQRQTYFHRQMIQYIHKKSHKKCSLLWEQESNSSLLSANRSQQLYSLLFPQSFSVITMEKCNFLHWQLHTMSTPVFQTLCRACILPCCTNGKHVSSGICNKTCLLVHMAKKVIVLCGNLAGKTGFLTFITLSSYLRKSSYT